MNSDAVFFYLYSLIAVAGAVGLVSAPRLIHAVVSMFATLFAIAAIYLLLGSQFLAAMQLFVYGGAITVLVLFVLMLTRPEAEQVSSGGVTAYVAMAVCLVLFGYLTFTLVGSQWELATDVPHTTASLAGILFSRYVLPFEIAGLALTIALIGAIVLAREDDVEEMAAGIETVAETVSPLGEGEAA